MAGDGKRFSDKGYTTPKPLIEVKGRTILEWTTNSLPFIEHNRQRELFGCPYHITFAIRSSHDVNQGLTNKLKAIYGSETKIISFDKLTRGNLDTAYLTIAQANYNPEEELLVLDADNKFDGSYFLNFIDSLPFDSDHGALCCFEPIDDSLKWCFAQLGDYGNVKKLAEKEKIKNGKPMVGVFYYSSHELFVETAEKILGAGNKVKNEFYMSQTFQYFLDNDIPLFGYKTKTVDPLGTPEDLERFLKK